jgi:hypothetical protein
MPVKRRTPKRRGRIALGAGLWELIFGPVAGAEAVFKTRRAMKEAWEASRDEVMGGFFGVSPGTRPWAWWEFDFTGEWPDEVPFVRQAEVIHRLKLGDAAELAEIEDKWRWSVAQIIERHLDDPKAARAKAVESMWVSPAYFDANVDAIAAEIRAARIRPAGSNGTAHQ